MGYGDYSTLHRSVRAESMGYMTKSAGEIFEKDINSAMNPHGVLIRESRDSAEHPNSVPIIIALDVTGSMGTVPHHLVKEGLPTIVEGLMKAGIAHPQILFLAIGDHECDRCPLQVGQFETSDELLDKWLTSTYIERGGGGNDGESYLLAWYFGAKHTVIDSLTKRGQKGFLFTIGDEPTLKTLPKSALDKIMGEGQQHSRYSASELLEEASKLYNVYHLHIRETRAGSMDSTIADWKQLIGHDSLKVIEHHEDVATIIPEIVISETSKLLLGEQKEKPVTGTTETPTEEPVKPRIRL